MVARRTAIPRHLVRDVAVLALSLFAVTCSGDKTTQPPPGPTQLVFKISPTSNTAGATFSPSVVVEAHDADGNLVSDFTGQVALTILTNPGGGTLSGTTSINAIGGVATFSSLSINKSGSGYRLQAASGSLTAAQSTLFDINAGPAFKLTFSNVPASFSAGVSFAVTVTALDQLDNVATDFTGQVTLALTATGGATLSGTTIVTASGGIANFVNLTIDKVGTGFSFTATGGGLTGGTSGAFNVSPGPATDLVITGQPSNTVAGANIAPAVAVTAHDGMGNVATAFTGSVCLAITSGSGSPGATLSGTTCVAAAAGVAAFGNLTIDKAGTGYTLSATAATLTSATTAPFDVAAGAATVLVYLVAPSSSFAGAAITPAVQVAAEDGHGNVVTSFTGNVAIAIGTNPAGGTLSGTTTVVAAAGIATFLNLSLDKAGTGYTLAASTSGLTATTSGAFNILSGAGAKLLFVVQPPPSVAAGAAMSPAVQVAVHDTLGNTATDFNGPISIAIANNPAGGTLSGTTTVSAVAGVATFATLNIDKVGVGYTLSASASVLSAATSTSFDVVPGPASKLVYTQQPSNATAGAGIAPAVSVTAVDAGGNLVSGFTGLVTVTLTTGTGNPAATLSGTNSVSAIAGVATFSNLSIDKVGNGYTLDAASSGLTGVTSNGFNIAAGAATQLVFSAEPSTAAGGATIAPAVTVTALDAQQNIATGFTGNITMSITGGTGTGGANLSGTLSVAAVSGVASFSTLSIDKAGAGYTLTAASGGLTSATSAAFDVVIGAATKLVFTAQPSDLITGGTMTPAVQVTAQDAGGNPVLSFTGDVTLSIGTNPSGGTLSGTTTVAAVAGVAGFSTLSIDKSGTGYTLASAASGLTAATSATFNVSAGAATHLLFTVQPATGPAGIAITPAVEVTAFDSLDNVATGFTGNVAMAIGTNPSAGILSGTTSVAAVAGVATFASLKIDKMGSGYTLIASSSGLTSIQSAAFDVLVGTATKLAFTVQPVNTAAGAAITPAIQVTAQDAAGNPVPSFAGSITLAIKSGTGTSGATLRGTTTVGAVSGVATFSTLSINKSGNGYVLNASSTGLTGASSSSFNITPGPAVSLAFIVQPAVSQKAGSSLTPTIRVAAVDSMLNTVTTFTSNITMAIGNNAGTPVPGTLTGTVIVKASAGVSSFNSLKINKVGTGYTLAASATGLLSATSTPFNVTPGNATLLTFTTPPVSTTSLTTMAPVAVTAFDAQGNVATGFTNNITMAIGTNPIFPNTPTLSGTLTVKAVAGVSSFTTLKIDSVANGYTLRATSSGLTAAISPSFDITNGSTLNFTVQPSAVNMGAAITPAVQVTAKDNIGNVLTAFTGNVTVAIAGGTGTAGAALGGTKTVAAVAGVATFSTLTIDKAGIGYKLTAASAGFTTGTSNAFTVNSTVGAATKLGFTVQPSTTPAGSTIIPGVVVAVQDAAGNTVTGLTGTVTIAFGSNPTGALLGGTTTVNVNAGLASFANLTISKAGTYTLTATTSLGLTPATSVSFTITTAATTHFAFTVQPSTTTAGANITPAVQVTAQNSSNVTVTSFTGPVTLAIAAGTGATGATLGGTVTVNAVNGVATFANLVLTKAGTGYKLTASSAGVAGATSASFAINPDVATTLHFAAQPTTTTANTIITPAVTVDARDQFNNLVKTFVGNVTVAITAGTGPGGAVLSGTKTVAAIAGVATFSDLSINLVGSGNTAYRLSATAGGLTAATSNAFSIN
ncbi:MAG TPA: hypothetical protein VL563_04130 [Gemmatimonadales bacterium]|nr:hypothetical protein [Gemmatimonadales bacterium]